MPRAASVWLDVLPSMAEFRRELRQQLEEPVRQSATRAGQQGGESLMSGMASKMKTGALAAGVAAGALVAKGVALSMEKNKAAGKIQATLGLSDQDAQRAGQAAGRLYANAVTESVDEGADAVKRIMQAGLAPTGATTKQLASLATKTQDLASLFEVDLGQAANAAGQAVKTGLAKNGAEALDVMFRGFQVMGPRADDLVDTFNEYGTIFRSLNLPIKTVTGLLAQGMKAGARDTDVVADSLKEFQIRATDGSKASAAGFKALGLSASGMTAQIAKGGKGASDGLQTVLDRLRKMKDPVARNAAAVALFGTKAEDMGKALFALDPSTAAEGLGKVGGAAKKAGDNLRKDAGTQFEAFKRKALMAIGDAAARYAIPALLKFARFLTNDVLPPVKTAASWLGDHFGPAVKTTGSVVSGVVHWFKEWGIWLSPLAVLIGGVTLALSAQAITTGVVVGVMSVYSLASRGIAVVTRGWAAAQALLNAVMSLNPFALVAIAVVALGVALVIAWKKSETFRNIVMGVWSAIQTGAMWLWTNGIKPMVDGFMAGLRWVGDAASWLWNTVLKPVFSAIDTGARILATILTIVVFGPIYLAVKLLGAVFSWLWSAAIKPVFGWIAAGAQLFWSGVQLVFGLLMAGLRTVGGWFKWLWNAAVKPVLGWITAGAQVLWAGVSVVFGWFMTGLQTVGGWFKWLWNAAVKPVLGWITAGAQVLWAGVKVVFGWLMTGLRTVGGWFKWLYDNGVKPAFNAIKSVISTVYNSGIKPVFDRLKSATHSIADAFDTARGGIKTAWDKVKGIAKTPVKFIIDTVYNGGIVKVWNAVAGKFGAPKLDKITGFARGGVLPGQSSYRQGDDQLVPMRKGEGVYVSEAMRDPYERARLFAVNRAAMQGRSLRAFQGEGFAKGGIFDWVKSAATAPVDLAKSGFDWLKDGIKASAEAGFNRIVKPLLDKIAGDGSAYRDMVTGVPKRMIKAITGYSGQADKEMDKAGVGGSAFRRGLTWARTQAGKRYQWGGNGNPSWDCSGFVSAIESVIRGQSPHRRWATGAFSGATAPHGWVLNKRSPYQIGITNAGVGHTAGTINGVNVESRGGDGVVVGSRARSYKDGLFTHHYGFVAKGYADGGKPRAGELAWVGERGPELVRFKGGEEVYNHADSLRMWEGLVARGFAKGTTAAKVKAMAKLGSSAVKAIRSPSRKGEQAGADLGAGLVAGMAATGPAIESAAARMGQAAARVTPRSGSGQPAPQPGHTYNIYPRTLDMTVRDLELLQRRQDALARVGRPR